MLCLGSLAAQDSSLSESDAFDRAARSGLNANQSPVPEDEKGISILSLLFQGGWFMIPLVALSILVVVVTIERFIALRKSRVVPDELIRGLAALGTQRGGFDPRDAYLITQQHPSSASRVVQTMLQKVGRPISEIESVVNDSSQREADRLHANVRWLTLAAAVSPLIGLLGTVWGMIQAFYDTTQLLPNQDKAEALAAGIYIALVTTLAGLMIAIPAAVFAHFFETRITRLFHTIDEFVFSLIPQIEKYEGQLRFSISDRPSGPGEEAAKPDPAAPASSTPENRPRKRAPVSP
jgi:biopolymer transport protein ExbB